MGKSFLSKPEEIPNAMIEPDLWPTKSLNSSLCDVMLECKDLEIAVTTFKCL